jgi:hypothetical protein
MESSTGIENRECFDVSPGAGTANEPRRRPDSILKIQTDVFRLINRKECNMKRSEHFLSER